MLLQTDKTGHGPTVPGAEGYREHGGRVLASLGGMFLELVMAGFRPDLDLRAVPAADLIRDAAIPGLRHYWSADLLSDDEIARVIGPILAHWRDGDFDRLRFPRDTKTLTRVTFALKDVFEEQEVDGEHGRERWPIPLLLDYWDHETTPFADGKDRW